MRHHRNWDGSQILENNKHNPLLAPIRAYKVAVEIRSAKKWEVTFPVTVSW